MFAATKADADRRATLPQKAEDYKSEFKPDFKMPDGWEIRPDHPLWAAGREIAMKAGMSQETFSELATLMVQDQVRQHEAVAEAVKERDASLGARAGERVEALNTWFKGMFGEQAGAQFAKTLFTKDIVEGFEKMKGALTSQNVTSFNGTGRQGEPPAGQIPGYEKMTPEQRWAAIDELNQAKAA